MRTITLIPNDSITGITLDIDIVKISKTITDICDNTNEIKLAEVNYRCLLEIVEFMKYKHDNFNNIDKWEIYFYNIERDFLRELMTAAYYLNIDSLINILAKTIAKIMTNMSVEQMRDFLGIYNDIRPKPPMNKNNN